jgi:hypothetical protein
MNFFYKSALMVMSGQQSFWNRLKITQQKCVGHIYLGLMPNSIKGHHCVGHDVHVWPARTRSH